MRSFPKDIGTMCILRGKKAQKVTVFSIHNMILNILLGRI